MRKKIIKYCVRKLVLQLDFIKERFIGQDKIITLKKLKKIYFILRLKLT